MHVPVWEPQPEVIPMLFWTFDLGLQRGPTFNMGMCDCVSASFTTINFSGLQINFRGPPFLLQLGNDLA